MLNAQKYTYKLNIHKSNGEYGFATAVAISNNGKLITAFHNINNSSSITATDYKGKVFSVKLGNISIKDDLAYIHINTNNIPYSKLDIHTPKLGNDIYLLNSENLLLKGIISKVKADGVIINVEISKGTSGSGIFTDSNKLLAIALNKDYLDKTSFGSGVDKLKNITSKFTNTQVSYKKSNKANYDYSYCQNKDDLAIWEKYSKSKNPNIQELHAIFLGLCEKVKRKDLTTEKAQFIYIQAKDRLLK